MRRGYFEYICNACNIMYKVNNRCWYQKYLHVILVDRILITDKMAALRCTVVYCVRGCVELFVTSD